MASSICFDSLDQLRGNTPDNGVGLDVFFHYSARCYHDSVTDGYTCQHGGVGSYPHVFANVDWCVGHALPFLGVQIMTVWKGGNMPPERIDGTSCGHRNRQCPVSLMPCIL